MASGKKNYFRHSFFASEDEKCQALIRSGGFDAYGKFWALIELLARQCEHGPKTEFKIHMDLVVRCWHSRRDCAAKTLGLCSENNLFLCTIENNIVSLSVPNLPKYLGRYESKLPPNVPNKRKEKKRKEKKEEKNLPLVGEVINYLNKIIGKNLDPKAIGNKKWVLARIKDGHDFKDFKVVIDNKFHQWKNSSQAKYIRPETLFGNRFDGYLNELDAGVQEAKPIFSKFDKKTMGRDTGDYVIHMTEKEYNSIMPEGHQLEAVE